MNQNKKSIFTEDKAIDIEKFKKIKFQNKPKPTRYVVTDKDGNPTAFYNSDLNPDIPPEAVKITEDHYQQFHGAYNIHPRVHHRFIKGKITVHTPTLTKKQQAHLAVENGLTISIKGILEPSKFGTDHHSISKFLPTLAVIALTDKFPGGSDKFPIKDRDGNWHVFDTIQFKAVAIACISFSEGCNLVAEGCSLTDDESFPVNSDGLPVSVITLKI